MVGGTLYKYFEFFFDTDYPNLFKNDSSDTMAGTYKNAPGLNIQDAYITFKPLGELVKLDAGFMLPPGPHNGLESAAKLYSTDYFVNTFRRSIFNDTDPLGSAGQNPQGRDLGIQLRALVLGGHLEARFGVFQGIRDNPVPASTGVVAEVGDYNIFRLAGRVQVNVLGRRARVLLSGDVSRLEEDPVVWRLLRFPKPNSARVHVQVLRRRRLPRFPLGPGIVTAQVDIVRWNDEIVSEMPVPTDTAYMVQAGYLIAPIMTTLFGQYERLVAPDVAMMDAYGNTTMVPDATNPSENRYGGGLSFWPYGHNMNLKVLGAHVTRNPAPHAFNQINLQWQLYFF